MEWRMIYTCECVPFELVWINCGFSVLFQFQYEQISLRRSNISNAIKLLICTTPISAKVCFEFDLLLISVLIVSVNSNAFPSGKTSSLHASWILKFKKKNVHEVGNKVVDQNPHKNSTRQWIQLFDFRFNEFHCD